MKQNTGNVTVEQMMKLLQVYGAIKGLEDVIATILGQNIECSYEQGVLGRMSLLEDVICELSPLEDTEALLAPMDFAVAGEEEAEAALAGSDVILADPLYHPVCPPDARLISLPHLAFSGRCFQKSMQILPDLDPAGLCAQEDVP